MELVWRGVSLERQYRICGYLAVEFNGVGSIGVGQVKVGSGGECIWVEPIMASPREFESKQHLCVCMCGGGWGLGVGFCQALSEL